MKRKTIALLLGIIMLITNFVSGMAFAAGNDFSNHWAEQTINTWLNKGYISGYEDGSIKPDSPITRAEFATIVNKAFKFNEKANIEFTDVKQSDWFYAEVQKAIYAGYMEGYSDTLFGPMDYITREQVAVIICRLHGLTENMAAAQSYADKSNISNWAVGFVGAALEAGLMKGYEDGSFRPQNKITRAEAIVALDRLLDIISKEPIETPPQEPDESELSEEPEEDSQESGTSKRKVKSIEPIIGDAFVGFELVAGILTPYNATVKYQWLIGDSADGTYVDIEGATSNKYVPVENDVGKYIKVKATGTGKYKGTVTSEAVLVKSGNKITKAEFVAMISDYFAWPHPTDYNDIWKALLKQFNDVKTDDPYGKQIEVAYEEGIIRPDAQGNFNPNSGITRQDAAIILARAFKIAPSDSETEFEDKDSISEDALGYVNALVELSLMEGRTSILFMPNELLEKEEAEELFANITASLIAPVQALPKQTVDPYTMEERNIAPRRYIKLYTPTDGARIFYTKGSSADGWPEVEDPTTESKEYIYELDGHISELVGLRSGELDAPDNYVIYKAIAVKDGKVSPVQTFRWHLYRPMDGPFQHELVFEKTETSPVVYQIFRDNESVRAMAWYIEGEESGILYDALQTPADVENLKTYLDENIAAKPYIVIVGHEHGDHDAQMPNFINAGVDVYLNKRGWSSVGRPGFGGVVTTPEAQAKVKDVEEGMKFDLGGGTVFEAIALPGHANGNVGIFDRQSGYLFSSDFYGCTRAGSADTVGVSGLRADLLLSFVQQAYSWYREDNTVVNSLFTGHDESALSDINLRLFEAALQKVVDYGEAGCTPSVRGGNSRTAMVGDMYKDGTNWIALEIGGKMGDNHEYLSSAADLTKLPYMSDPKNENINYNAGGHVKYSVLSNIEIIGGELVGQEVQWARDAAPFDWAGQTIAVNPSLQNRFNPWAYDYTIKVSAENDEITIIPTTMSTKVQSIMINGEEVGYRSENTVSVDDGTVITIEITAPDGVTKSTYTFTIDKVYPEATPLSSVEPPVATDDEGNQLPLTGFFKDSLSVEGYEDREVFWYIPETAVLRPYYHFIAVPNDVDPGEFLIESGWKQISDETGECLFVLVPGASGKWGELEYEKGYMAAARAKHGGVGSYFTTFGEFYLTGYGEGAAPLEAWSAENPNLVIAQSYLGGTSVGTDVLNTAGAVSFGWNHMTDGDRNRLDEEGRQEILKQMADRLKGFLHPDLVGYEGLLTKDDMAVPTWLINTEGEDSLTYWKKVNRATGDDPDQTFAAFGGVDVSGSVFKQMDDTWSTEYAGRISKVTTVETPEDVVSYEFSRALRDDMTDYTRYDVTISYGNGLTYRLDYTDIQVERYTSPKKEATGTVKGIGLDGEEVEGEIAIKLLPVGTGDAKSDILLFVPDIAGDSDIPVVVVSHGGSQTGNLFMDSTTWWQTAAKEGFAIVLATRTTWSGSSRINNNDVFDVIIDWLEDDGRFDMGRIYATGQSAGGGATFGYVRDYTDKLAAAYWSNAGISSDPTEDTKAIPAGLFIGEGNSGFRGIPLFNSKEEAEAAGAVMYWDSIGTEEAPQNIARFKKYFYSANGISQDNISDTIIYRGGNAMNRGEENPNGTIAEWQTNNARYRTFTWLKDIEEDAEGIPVLSYTLSLYQAHNNLPGYNAIMWDFFEHYRVEVDENDNVKRYYSPSGFVEDDEVEIFAEEAEPDFTTIYYDEIE